MDDFGVALMNKPEAEREFEDKRPDQPSQHSAAVGGGHGNDFEFDECYNCHVKTI